MVTMADDYVDVFVIFSATLRHEVKSLVHFSILCFEMGKNSQKKCKNICCWAQQNNKLFQQ